MTYIGKVSGGKVILPPDAELEEGASVRVVPLNGPGSGEIDLRARGIDPAQAAEVRARLAAFAEEWDSPEMDLYNDYDAAKANL
jgi:hypothetical protein